MNCESAVEKIVEYARRDLDPGAPVRVHMRECAECRERLEAEKNLTHGLNAMRAESAGQRSSERSRQMLLSRFDAKRPAPVRRRWVWALPAAAGLLLGMALLHPVPKSVSVGTPAQAQDPAYVMPADPQDDGFVAVPFVPPLATGELVRVVHTELYPSALASLGINVDPTLTSGVAADLLMGEDGFPRAVRVSNEF